MKTPIKNIWPIVLGIMFSLSGCAQSSKEAETEAENKSAEKIDIPENKKLSPALAHELIAADSNMIILDVRTPEEFESGHITKAVNIDFFADDFKDNLLKLDKEKTYLVYCKGGKRSNKARILMDSLAFKQVYDLIGGFQQWSESDLPYQQEE